MGRMYKVGDEVTVKSLEWYEENRNEIGKICDLEKKQRVDFVPSMTAFCGKRFTIEQAGFMGDEGYYQLEGDEDGFFWRSWMFEREDFSPIESLLESLHIEDYTRITHISSFEPNKWIQSTTTKEFTLFWNVEGERIVVMRKIGIYKII